MGDSSAEGGIGEDGLLSRDEGFSERARRVGGRRGAPAKQDGSWCWINDIEKRAEEAHDGTRRRAHTTEAKAFNATIHNMTREEIVRRGGPLHPPSLDFSLTASSSSSSSSFSSSVSQRNSRSNSKSVFASAAHTTSVEVPFSPISRGADSASSSTSSNTNGAAASKATGAQPRRRGRTSSKGAGAGDTWDWIMGIQDDLRGNDITRLRHYVARQKALATGTGTKGSLRSGARREKSRSMHGGRSHGQHSAAAHGAAAAAAAAVRKTGAARAPVLVARDGRVGSDGSDGSASGMPLGIDAAGTTVYTCSDEELSYLRAELARDFPESERLYSDGYLRSVVAQYDSAHPKRRRTLKYCVSLFFICSFAVVAMC